MNAFEDIVKLFLEEEGYWIRQSVKVEISKEEKKKIGLPSMPRPEIDLVGLNVKENLLLLIEVKSFLDSSGVYWEPICDEIDENGDCTYGNAKHYRLFTHKVYRKIVSKRIRQEYLRQGLINEETKIGYALAAGNFHSDSENKIREHFSKHGRNWKVFSPTDIKKWIKGLSGKGWEDNVIITSVKLVTREK